jgi:ATP-dependent Clp endopeptidase proteolytic subunit ClpP
MVRLKLGPGLRKDIADAVTRPIVVVVNEFNEEAVADFREAVESAILTGQSVLPVVVDSVGGDVYALLAMLDILDRARATVKIATIAEGKAMSCGAVLMSCGDAGYRFVGPNATVMIHGVSGGVGGTVEDMQSSTDEARRLQVKLMGILGSRSGMGAKHFEAKLSRKRNADWFLSPKDCLKNGIADHIRLPEYLVSLEVAYTFG